MVVSASTSTPTFAPVTSRHAEVRYGDQAEDSQRDGTSDRSDHVHVKPDHEHNANKRDETKPAERDPRTFAPSVAGTASSPQAVRLSPRGIDPGVGRPRGREQSHQTHQPVPGFAQDGLRGHRDRRTTGGDDLLYRQGTEPPARPPHRRPPQSPAPDTWPSAVPARVFEILGCESHDAESEEGEERERHARDDIPQRRIPRSASNCGLMFSSVATANNARLPITTKTITVCARATTCDPTMLRTVITRMMRTANSFVHITLPSANTALA